jgi:hypothetical protein
MIIPSPDQLRIVTVICAVALLLFGLRRPVYAVIAYMILVYCKLSSYYPFFAQIHAESLFAVLILLRIAATGDLFSKLSVKNNSINKYIYLLIACVALSFSVAWDRQYSWDHAVYHFIKTIVLYVMIIGAIENRQDLKIFVWSFVLMFSFLAYEPTYYYLTGTSGSQQMYGTNYIAETGILSGHVALANNVNQMLPITLFLYFGSQNKWLRSVAIISFLIFLVALVGSGSRGGIVGMLVWGSLIVYFAEPRARKTIIALLLVVVFFTGAGSMVMRTASRIDADSTKGRLIGLTHGIGMLRKGNVVGVGPGCYLIARQKYFSYRMESHNIYGQIIGDLGIPGIIVTFLLMREIFRILKSCKLEALKFGDQEKFFYFLLLGVQISLITRLVVSMASHGLYYFYWYVMAAIVVVSQRLIHTEALPDKSGLNRKIINRVGSDS